MSFLSNFLKTKEKPKEIQDKTNDTVDMIPLDIENIRFIEEAIAKLKLINLSHGQTEYLTKQILTYENKLSEIKENYEEENTKSQDTLTLVLQDKRMEYLLSLSTLKDEVEHFSKICFDLEGLDVLLHQEITGENINAKKEELKKLEQQIELHKNEYPKLGNQLQEKLIEVIWHVLEQEVKLNQEHDLYMKLSRNSSLLIQKKYLEKLVELAEKDSYIQEYLKQTNIQFIDFDYEMLSYMVSGKLPKKEMNQPCLNFKSEVSILKRDQIVGKKALKIFNVREAKAVITDYAILLGGRISGYNGTLEGRTGHYWTKKRYVDDDKYIVEGNRRTIGTRPTLPFSSISSTCLNMKVIDKGILEVEYGEYPHWAVLDELQHALEDLYQKGELSKTGKVYTRDNITNPILIGEKFKASQQEEFELNGKKYVRVYVGACSDGTILSNKEQYLNGNYAWVEVEPIKWLVDLENDIAVSEKILFAGVQFNYIGDYKGDFENTDLKWYLDAYFSKEIIPSNVKTNEIVDDGIVDEQSEKVKILVNKG